VRRTGRIRHTPAEDTEVVTRASGIAPVEDVPVPASPAVRRFAREIGVDIRDVPGTGPGGRISIEDVKRYAQRRAAAPEAAAPAAPGPAVSAAPLPDFSQWGPVRREPMSNVRRVTARQMAIAWATIPHVTLHASADVTELEQIRARYKKKVEEAGGRLTLTALLVKAVAESLPRHPRINASVDLDAREIILKEHVHVGVAVDTERGLLVPVVRDADRKNVIRIAVEMAALVEKARAGRLTPDEMAGATFTVTNLGAGPVGYFKPIINPPQAAILGVGRAQEADGRRRLPLSLSVDHRILDGADGARFLESVVDALEHPLMLVLEE
jgi:pyruvate dehydrogenase E2 component (dihydrolipoamide acetyltransferase)